MYGCCRNLINYSPPPSTLKSAPVWMISSIATLVMTQSLIFLFVQKTLKLCNWVSFPFLANPTRLLSYNVLEQIYFFKGNFAWEWAKGSLQLICFLKTGWLPCLPQPYPCPRFLPYLLCALAGTAVPLCSERNLAASAVWPTAHSHVCKAGVSWHSAQAWPDSFINSALTTAPNYFSWHKAKLCYSPNAPIYSSQDKRTYR